jgi:predicted alpha/beta hydrolase
MTNQTITVPLQTPDAHRCELIEVAPPAPRGLVYWLPAMGVAARHYQTLGGELAARGIGAVLHEWRGGGSSNWRAARRRDWGYAELIADARAGIAETRARHPERALWVGGHSLGAQLAALAFATDTEISGLAFAGSGVPHWRCFSGWQKPLALAAFGAVRGIAGVVGHYPGKQIGFAGREARSVMRDWARSGVSGRYRPAGIGDLEPALAARAGRVLGIRLRDDSYVPRPAFDALLGKFRAATVESVELAPTDFASQQATHFSWLKDAGPVAERIAGHVLGAPKEASRER